MSEFDRKSFGKITERFLESEAFDSDAHFVLFTCRFVRYNIIFIVLLLYYARRLFCCDIINISMSLSGLF